MFETFLRLINPWWWRKKQSVNLHFLQVRSSAPQDTAHAALWSSLRVTQILLNLPPPFHLLVWMSECSHRLCSNEVIRKQSKKNDVMRRPQRGCRLIKKSHTWLHWRIKKDKQHLYMKLQGVRALQSLRELKASFTAQYRSAILTFGWTFRLCFSMFCRGTCKLKAQWIYSWQLNDKKN